MRKRIAALLLAAVMMFALCACGHTHTFEEETVKTEATCTADGVGEHTCSECGKTEETVIPATGHVLGAPVSLGGRLCTEAGQVERICSVCEEKVIESVGVSTHEFVPATAFAPKTCTVCGLSEGKAKGEIVAIGDTVTAEEHSFTVDVADFSGALSDKRGWITYNHSGNYVFFLKLYFRNLASESFARWGSDRIADMKLKYQDKYEYEGEYWVPATDIVPFGRDFVYVTYEVPESMSTDFGSSLQATFTIDGIPYGMTVREADPNAKKEAPAAANTEEAVAIGDVRTDGDDFSFELKDVFFTDKPTEQTGNVTRTYGGGEHYLVCKLEFTNLAAESLGEQVSNRITDMLLTYNGETTYEGTAWIPADEIVPLASGSLYVIFEVSKAVEKGTEPLTAAFAVDGNTFLVDCRG